MVPIRTSGRVGVGVRLRGYSCDAEFRPAWDSWTLKRACPENEEIPAIEGAIFFGSSLRKISAPNPAPPMNSLKSFSGISSTLVFRFAKSILSILCQ